MAIGSSFAHAQWQPADAAKVVAYNNRQDCTICWRLTDPYLSSLSDELALQMGTLFRHGSLFPGSEEVTLKIPSKAFVRPSGRVQNFRGYHWPRPERSPLVVYLPGIFQEADDANTFEAVSILIRAGNRALIIPNPLSRSYMVLSPHSSPAQFIQEAQATLEIIAAYKKAFANDISSIHLVGASYGGFVAAVVIALDSASREPLIDGQTTIYFPPFNMSESVRVLDHMIDAHVQGQGGRIMRLIGAEFQGGLHGLLQRMQARLLADRAYGFVARTYPPAVEERLAAFNLAKDGKSIRFWKVINDYIGEDVDFYSRPDARLSHWLEQAKNHGNVRLRILTTDNDWLNQTNAIEELPAWLREPQHLLIRTTGGHAGIVASRWFHEFTLRAMNFVSVP